MSSDDHDGWRFVIGSNNKSIKGDITKWGNVPKSKKILSFFSPLEKNDKIKTNVNIADIISNINSMIPILQNSEFYSVIRKNLEHFRSKTFRIIVLGCASPTYGPFITNCKWQWSLVKLLTEDTLLSLNISYINIFDPIMTEIDYNIWESFIGTSDCSLYDNTLLIMPHCEVELYQAVLEALTLGDDPIEAAHKLSDRVYTPSISQYNIDNTIAISNSLIECEHINLNNEFKEIRLPPFEPCPNAFNNLYISYV